MAGRSRSVLRTAGATLVACVFALAVSVSPAYAVASSGTRNNFAVGCDAYVTVSTNTKPGRVEAWGGYAFCDRNISGWARVYLFRDGRQVSESYSGACISDQCYADTDVANPPGQQTWRASVYITHFTGVPGVPQGFFVHTKNISA